MTDYCKTIVDSRYWAITKPSSMELAPAVYRNWLAYLGGKQCHGTDEYAVLTDSHICGELNHRDPGRYHGPYEVVSTGYCESDESTQIRLVVRVSRFLYSSPLSWSSETPHPYELCNDNGIAEDLVALLSLCLGIPLQCGCLLRTFSAGGPAEGRPAGFDIHSLPERPRGTHSARLIPLPPSGQNNLCSAAEYLSVIPDLEPAQSSVLVRAARLYRDALWYSDSMPNMAWLMLVNALETVSQDCASEFSPDSFWYTPLGEKLLPLLNELSPAENQLNQFACVIGELSGVTSKLRTFISCHLPPPPPRRPAAQFCVEWNEQAIKKVLNGIYAIRSKCVHNGMTFPSYLCQPAEMSYEDKVPAEYPPPYEGKPKAVHMHIFAHIVRGAILQWWTNAGKQPSRAKGLSGI